MSNFISVTPQEIFFIMNKPTRYNHYQVSYNKRLKGKTIVDKYASDQKNIGQLKEI